MKKSQNIINKILPVLGILIFLGIWQLASDLELVSKLLLPSPIKVVKAFFKDINLLMMHSKTSLVESFLGLSIGASLGFLLALIMDYFDVFRKMFYPLVIISQTIPTIAIAPLLVLWFGYEMTPKVVLIIIVTFFPVAVGVLDGFKSVDKDIVKLLKSMGANDLQILRHAKLPNAIGPFFTSLRISASYSIVGAVIAEWLGGNAGLGVYITRVRKSYSFDKMFAVILLISLLSLLLMKLVDLGQYFAMPWEHNKKSKEK